jgi:hypothetical protein
MHFFFKSIFTVSWYVAPALACLVSDMCRCPTQIHVILHLNISLSHIITYIDMSVSCQMSKSVYEWRTCNIYFLILLEAN